MSKIHLRQTKKEKVGVNNKKRPARASLSEKAVNVLERLADEKRTPKWWFESDDDPTKPA